MIMMMMKNEFRDGTMYEGNSHQLFKIKRWQRIMQKNLYVK